MAAPARKLLEQLDYVTQPLLVGKDDSGQECVLLPVDEFARLIGDMEILAGIVKQAIANWDEGDFAGFDEFVAELKNDGVLPADWTPELRL
jgi:hypothetical protein